MLPPLDLLSWVTRSSLWCPGTSALEFAATMWLIEGLPALWAAPTVTCTRSLAAGRGCVSSPAARPRFIANQCPEPAGAAAQTPEQASREARRRLGAEPCAGDGTCVPWQGPGTPGRMSHRRVRQGFGWGARDRGPKRCWATGKTSD